MTAWQQNNVKPALTAKRHRRVVENDEYGAFLRRAIRAYSRRVGSGDIDAVTDLIAIAAYLDKAIHDAISDLHDTGHSWAEIAARISITRQAAQQRWGTGTLPPDPPYRRSDAV